jgi:RNA polymerase sigma factor (sigma-70 family)
LEGDGVKIQNRILLRRAIHDKDREALGRLHSIYYSRIKRYIASRINSIPDAENLTQDLFFELCEGNGCYDGQRDAEAYLVGMARNIIGCYHRNKKKHPQTIQINLFGDVVADCDVQQHQPVSLQELKELLEDATGQIPPKAREAARLRLGEGLTTKKAAEKCGCSTEAFYKRFHAALKTLEVMRETGSFKANDAVNL